MNLPPLKTFPQHALVTVAAGLILSFVLRMEDKQHERINAKYEKQKTKETPGVPTD